MCKSDISLLVEYLECDEVLDLVMLMVYPIHSSPNHGSTGDATSRHRSEAHLSKNPAGSGGGPAFQRAPTSCNGAALKTRNGAGIDFGGAARKPKYVTRRASLTRFYLTFPSLGGGLAAALLRQGR